MDWHHPGNSGRTCTQYNTHLGCGSLLVYHVIIGEMWIGITLAIVVELVPSTIRTSAVAVYLFIISNIVGNMPLLVPVQSDINSLIMSSRRRVEHKIIQHVMLLLIGPSGFRQIETQTSLLSYRD